MFLDRDGILNRAIIRNGRPYPPSSLEELETSPGIEKACHDLRGAGLALIMVTNQPDVARGSQTREVVEAINQFLSSRLCLDDVKVCYHDEADKCMCRKPRPGLLYEAAEEWDIDLSRSFMIGDRWKDVEAGRSAGCKTVFVDYAYDEKKPQHPDYLTNSVADAVNWILKCNE